MTTRIYSDLATPGSDWAEIDQRMVEIQEKHPRMSGESFKAALVNKAINDVMGPKVAAFRERFNRGDFNE